MPFAVTALLLTSLLAPPLTAQSAQELYVSDFQGGVHRIRDYASNPTAELVTTVPWPLIDIAVHPTTGDVYGIVQSTFFNAGLDVVLIDAETGAWTGFLVLPNWCTGIDFGDDPDYLFARTRLGNLWRFDLSNHSAITGFTVSNAGEIGMGDLATLDGSSSAVLVADGRIQRIDHAPSNSASLLVDTGLGLNPLGFDIDCSGQMVCVTWDGELWLVDPALGATRRLGVVGIPGGAFGLSFRDGPSNCAVGAAYCAPAPLNSTGRSGRLTARGSTFVEANAIELRSFDLPPNALGMFLTSRASGFVSMPIGSQGDLCLGGSIGRFAGPGQVQSTGPSGELRLTLDLTALPAGAGFVPAQVGETWYFQGWHRDAVGGQATSNFTHGLALGF